MDKSLRINIPILGAVSAGKSTLVNGLFVKTYSHMKIRRTTMVPQVYHETDEKNYTIDCQEIMRLNKNINDRINEKEIITKDDLQEVNYFVPTIDNLISRIENVYLSFYDTPGLNDSKTKDLYFDYVKNNFYKFDIIFYVIDINSSMNTHDEFSILKLILENMKNNKNNFDITNYLLIILNKCDNIYKDDNGELKME